MNLDNAAHTHVSCKSGTLYLCAIPLEIKLLIFLILFFCGFFRALLEIHVEDLLSVTHCALISAG